MRIMKRTAVVATGLATAAALTLGAAPAATAATPDGWIYPQSGYIYVDPISVQVLGNSPVGDFARVGANMVLSTVGPTTTVAVLNSIGNEVNIPIRNASKRPGSSVEIRWNIINGGNSVIHSYHINWA